MEELLNRIEKLESDIKKLTSSSTIPLEVDRAFRSRLNLDTFSTTDITVSSKNADSEDVSVDEGGAGTYSVMNDPDGFLELEIEGDTYYLPYFT